MLSVGQPAPPLAALDSEERPVDLRAWWSEAPLVAIFLRHFG